MIKNYGILTFFGGAANENNASFNGSKKDCLRHKIQRVPGEPRTTFRFYYPDRNHKDTEKCIDTLLYAVDGRRSRI